MSRSLWYCWPCLLLLFSACNLLDQPEDVPPRTTGAPTPDVAIPPTETFQAVYYLVSDSPAQNAIPVGCDGYVLPAFTGTALSGDPAADIRASLGPLLAMTSTTVGQSGLTNYLGGQGLVVAEVTVTDTEAAIAIDGTLMLTGACADPLVEAQILLTVFSVPAVESAHITIGGRNMKQIFDMSDQTANDAVYTSEDVRRR